MYNLYINGMNSSPAPTPIIFMILFLGTYLLDLWF